MGQVKGGKWKNHYFNAPLLLGLRLRKGLTQTELADAIGMKLWSICAYENGRRCPSQPTVKKLADYFQVDASLFKSSIQQKAVANLERLLATEMQRELSDDEAQQKSEARRDVIALNAVAPEQTRQVFEPSEAEQQDADLVQ